MKTWVGAWGGGGECRREGEGGENKGSGGNDLQILEHCGIAWLFFDVALYTLNMYKK